MPDADDLNPADFAAGGPAPEEPSSPMRTLARWMRDAYVAMRAEGFTEGQALLISGRMFAEMLRHANGNTDNDDG